MRCCHPLILLLLSLLLSMGVLAAPPLLLDATTTSCSINGHIDVLEDPRGKLKIADLTRPDVARRFYTLADTRNDPNFGYTGAVYWLRVSLQVRAGGEGKWLAEVDFPTLDQVTLYVPQQHLEISEGDTLPFAARPIANRNLVFPLQLPAIPPQYLYFRVESEGSLTVPIRLWREDAFRSHNQDGYAILCLYFGMLLALGSYNLLLYLSLRDRLYLAYVAFVASMVVGQVSLNGLGNQYLWPQFPTWGNAAYDSGFAAAGLFGAWFIRLFLDTPRVSPKVDRIIISLMLVFAVAALGPLFMSYRWAAVITSLSGIVLAVVAEVAGIIAWRRHQPGAKWFLLAWTLLLAGIGIAGTRNMGWIPSNFFIANAMQMGSALEMLLLSFALADRIQVARREKEAAQAEALLSKELALRAVKASEQELEQRVSERTRELADANTRLVQGEERLKYLAHHDPLTGLANRLLLYEHLASALARARRQGICGAIVVIDLDDFKPVNDTHGHEVGDELLVAVAAGLRSCVREADLVARLGGDEFVLVLERIYDNASATLVADKIGEAVMAAGQFLSKPMLISASMGIVIFPDHGNDASELLRHADEAMYQAKHAGRQRWFLYPGRPEAPAD